MNRVLVAGAGLAGCEAAWQLAGRGVPVTLIEMKPKKMTPAHHNPSFAELVCSNSLRSGRLENAVGLLKEELRRMGSLIISCADKCRVEAGGALAVDRLAFSEMVTARVKSCPDIEIIEDEVTEIPSGNEVIIATGPLTSEPLARSIAEFLGEADYLGFFDAAAPIVSFDSVDMGSAYFASRYGRGTPDYVNCPLTEEQYLDFWRELSGARQAQLHGFEDDKVFEGCVPVEVLARRGRDTLRYGPMKPVGLPDPRTGREPYAVIQLRRDNAKGSIYNIVGFQTHLTFDEQRRVFSMVPALRGAKFERYGVMHRNTYLDSPRLLNRYYQVMTEPRVSFAGQITGVEGYVESTASGLLAGIETARRMIGKPPLDLPGETATGALALYVSEPTVADFQPMNINFGIMPPLGRRVKGKRDKNLALSMRALAVIDGVIADEAF